MSRQLKWFDALAPVGVLALLAPFVLGGRLPGRPNYYVIAGLLLVISHIVLRWELIEGILGRRQLRHGGNAVALSLVVLGILGVTNWILNRHVNRWDFTKEKRFGLSEQTLKVLAGLKEDIRMVYFENPQGLDAPEERRVAEDRLREYQAHSSHVKVESNNPLKDPALARRLEITAVPTLVVERGEKRERINNVNEQDITNALIKVTRTEKKTICFAKGEGEHDADESGGRGLSEVKRALESTSYQVASASLLGSPKELDSCAVVVLAGPERDLLPESADRLRQFVKRGGKALVMVEPEFKGALPNLDTLIKEWGADPGNDVLLQVSGLQLTPRGLEPVADERVAVNRFPAHEITKDMSGLGAVFRSVRSVQASSQHVTGVSSQNFLESGKDSWAESDLTLKASNPDKGRRGPVPFGVVSTIQTTPPAASGTPSPSPAADERKPESETRVAIVGDSDFATNAVVGYLGNRDLFLNVVSWLVKDADLISIRPKEEGEQRLTLVPRSGAFTLVVATALVILPGLFVVAGFVVWVRRR
jgi:ABC-type uncharacterized transport system involved in gliding motility auxiliary subunit